jgi:hypothetical protein
MWTAQSSHRDFVRSRSRQPYRRSTGDSIPAETIHPEHGVAQSALRGLAIDERQGIASPIAGRALSGEPLGRGCVPPRIAAVAYKAPLELRAFLSERGGFAKILIEKVAAAATCISTFDASGMR